MRNAFDRVRKGESLDIHYQEYNAFIDSSVRDNPEGFGDLFERFASSASRRVKIFNGSGSDIAAGEIAKLGAPSFTSGDHFESYTFELETLVPSSDRGFVFFPNIIADDEYGQGVIGGIAYAPVNVLHASHDRCDVGTETQLASGFSGHARILWKPVGTGVANCVIDIGDLDQGEVKGVATVDIAADGSGAVSVYKDGADTVANITAHLNWMHGSEKVSLGKEVLCRWFSDELKWVIIGAECE